MLHVLRRNLIRSLKMAIWGRWPKPPCLDDGYTMLVPIPADLPFLLRFALEGLRHQRMPNCKQILVLSDGAASDHDLRTIIAENGDERVRDVPPVRFDKILMNLLRAARLHLREGVGMYRHFTQMLRGVLAATTDVIYLHDADAFWLDEGGVESQYREFRDRGMYTLGVTSRIDKMFRERGIHIPGTWELMFSNSWVRRRPPIEMKCGWYPLPEGEWRWFNTLDYGQYLDYASGRVGVMATPPQFVHFYGTIVEYRRWQSEGRSRPTEDELFTLLLISILAEVVPGGRCDTPLPHPQELARGLRDPAAPITYLADSAPRRYAAFRSGIEGICSGPVFASAAGRIRELLAPFDEHFAIP